jgi:RNA polymerase sigma-70 factor (ECF subfamily)
LTATARKNASHTLPEDFEEIFRAHHDLVYRAAYRITGNAEDAEDVLQTVFLRLLRRERLPDAGGNPKGYFHRAAVNAALDVLKKRNRNAPLSGEAGADVSAWGRQGNAEVRECLRAALAELSPRSAEIFVLRHIEGYGNGEIAKLLGISRGAVAVMLVRARIRLRKSIRTYSGDKP